MKKFTVEEIGMVITALNQIKNRYDDEAAKCHNENKVLAEKYFVERANAYRELYYKVSDMLEDICE